MNLFRYLFYMENSKPFLNNLFETNKLIIVEAVQLMWLFYISYFVENTFIHMAIFVIILFIIWKPQSYALLNEGNKKFNYYLLITFFILFTLSINLEIYILYEFWLWEFNYIYNLIYWLLLYTISIILLRLVLKKVNSKFSSIKKQTNSNTHKETINLLNQADELIISWDQKWWIVIFNKILEENPNEISALFWKAQALYQLNNLEKCLEVINSYILKDIDNTTKIISYNMISWIFYKLWNLKESLIYNKMILDIDPNNEDALFNKVKMESNNKNTFW